MFLFSLLYAGWSSLTKVILIVSHTDIQTVVWLSSLSTDSHQGYGYVYRYCAGLMTSKSYTDNSVAAE